MCGNALLIAQRTLEGGPARKLVAPQPEPQCPSHGVGQPATHDY